MKIVVTGVAGFIGSHLAEKLLDEHHEVLGVDMFLDNYARDLKQRNLAGLKKRSGFSFIEQDLLSVDCGGLLNGVDYLFHLAGQPGVRSSWGRDFARYTDNNILVTQNLLEAARSAGLKKFVYASTSSVYGDTDDLPMRETGRTRPVSPYGVSKLSAEHLCYLYFKAYGIPTVSLRFFTVYGPRQRADMFFHIAMRGLLKNEEVPLFDDGEQTRDFTYCSDIVDGVFAAGFSTDAGEIFNLGGGTRNSLLNAIAVMEDIAGRKLRLKRFDRQKGDVRHTFASIEHAQEKLGYSPGVSLEQGLARQWEWIQTLGY
ncbi:MAG TPA: NAD-dependent epimerase/dehydratase family protein [Candidatus Binatia bacterium]|jgi:UDP-glucose 4-epimerase